METKIQAIQATYNQKNDTVAISIELQINDGNGLNTSVPYGTIFANSQRVQYAISGQQPVQKQSEKYLPLLKEKILDPNTIAVSELIEEIKGLA